MCTIIKWECEKSGQSCMYVYKRGTITWDVGTLTLTQENIYVYII